MQRNKVNVKVWRRIAAGLAAALMLFTLVSCQINEPTNTPTGPAPTVENDPTQGENTLPQPPDGDQGVLGGETPAFPEEDKPTPPPNPEISLLQHSSQEYDTACLGCTKITVLSEYVKGLDHDVVSIKDGTNKVFSLYLPCRVDLSCLTFNVTHRDGSVSGPYTANFLDDEITENESVIGGVSNYAIRVHQSNLPSIMLNIDESYVTIGQLNGDKEHKTFAYGDMFLTVTDQMARSNGWATRYVSLDENADKYCSMDIRGRGNASWKSDKKPYQIRTENSLNLLGMGHADTWALLANYNDATGVRTQLAMELGLLLEYDYTSAYQPVDLFMNGKYLGLYTLIEKIEVGPNRVEIDESVDVLYEVDQYYLEQGIYGFATTDTPNSDLRRFRIHAPEVPELVDRSKQILITAENALYSGNEDEFLKYFDLESWAKSYIINCYTMNSDAYYGSFYFYYDDSDGKMHACSPWDFDWSLGISFSQGNNIDPMRYDITKRVWMKPMMKYQSFQWALMELYYEDGAKQIVESMPNIARLMGTYGQLSGDMNFKAVPNRIYPETALSYDASLEYLYSICDARVLYMELHMQNIALDVGYPNFY